MRVEVKVVGMFGLDMITAARHVELPAGARVKDAIRALHRSGAVTDDVYQVIKLPMPPNMLVINDTPQAIPDVERTLVDGDVVSVLQMISGG